MDHDSGWRIWEVLPCRFFVAFPHIVAPLLSVCTRYKEARRYICGWCTYRAAEHVTLPSGWTGMCGKWDRGVGRGRGRDIFLEESYTHVSRSLFGIERL